MNKIFAAALISLALVVPSQANDFFDSYTEENVSYGVCIATIHHVSGEFGTGENIYESEVQRIVRFEVPKGYVIVTCDGVGRRMNVMGVSAES